MEWLYEVPGQFYRLSSDMKPALSERLINIE